MFSINSSKFIELVYIYICELVHMSCINPSNFIELVLHIYTYIYIYIIYELGIRVVWGLVHVGPDVKGSAHLGLCSLGAPQDSKRLRKWCLVFLVFFIGTPRIFRKRHHCEQWFKQWRFSSKECLEFYELIQLIFDGLIQKKETNSFI